MKLGDEIYTARRKAEDFEKVLVCNCSGCGQELIGAKNAQPKRLSEKFGLPIVYARLRDRPLCEGCYQQKFRRPGE